MSKLYKKYLDLKSVDNSKIYIFKSGIFYIFLDEDAKKISPILNLKLTNFSPDILKCGFPVNSIEKYLNMLNSLNYSVQIIDTSIDTSYKPKDYKMETQVATLIQKINSIDTTKLSIRQAYEFIDTIQELAKNLIH